MSEARVAQSVDARQMLRSINIALDGATPERIAHFFPTAKSARLIRAWLAQEQSGGYFVVAPYGSGKSLTAAFFLQLVENREASRAVLAEISERFTHLDNVLADTLRARIERPLLFDQHGAVVVLSGFQAHLPAAIGTALAMSLRRTGHEDASDFVARWPTHTIEDAIALLGALRNRYCPDPIDRLAIVWDEFGRHLEELVVGGRAASLSDLQTLAEFCARTKRVPTTLALLLHQGLIRYAANTSVTVQREWRKIEGRFETIQFVDDSKELYQLAGEIVRRIRSCRPPEPELLARSVRRCREHGLFGDFSTAAAKRLLADSYPLEPVTLYLLPRVSARVAQNERTLFTFLNSLATNAPVSPDKLYDYFSDAMRADVLTGGSYHAWLETESALHSTRRPLDARTLKCACLLGLGLVGERARVSRRLLEWAVAGYRASTAARGSVQRLIESNLLLYRRNSDSVSIWHGTDLDLRGRLDREKARVEARFDLVSFLATEAPPAPWKSIEYNGEYGVDRFFESRYVAAQEIIMAASIAQALPPVASADGTLYVVVPATVQEAAEVRERIAAQAPAPTVVAAVPRNFQGIADIALEVYALQLLRQDAGLLAEDPLAESELAQMTDDAQGYLGVQLSRLLQPSAEGPEYLCDRHRFTFTSAKELRQFLSTVMRRVYPLTPRIKNELIVRRRPRPAIVNARKKLILAILEHSEAGNMGLEGYRPDVSMFRTVLLLTGLYRNTGDQPGKRDAGWRYARPEELADPGLREVWEMLRDFLTASADQPKPLANLTARLGAAPYGVRAGLVPILIAAALRAFPGPINITRTDGAYVSDLLPSTIEEMAARPTEYHVLVPDLAPEQRTFLDRVAALFGCGPEAVESDPVRRCHDALARWRSGLPHGAFTSRHLSAATRAFGRRLTETLDPYRLLFTALPEAFGLHEADGDELLHALGECKVELEEVLQWNYEAAGRAIRAAFPALNRRAATLREVVGAWAGYFPASVTGEIKEGIARALVTRARMGYDSDRALADALAALLVGKRIDRWEDSSIVVFERELGAVIRRVEDTVLNLAASTNGAGSQAIVDIATSRLQAALHAISSVAGSHEARAIVSRSLEQLNEEEVSPNGVPARGARSAL